jgi:hypothetical protein
MKRTLSAVVASTAGLALLAAAANTASAHPVPGNLPGGTSISVAIDSPTDGAVVAPGPVTVSGTASIGEGLAEPDTALVYVLDVSGSTTALVPGGCGVGANDDILDCEVAAAQNLNAEAIASQAIGAAGVVVFATTAAAADVTPGGGDDAITGPATDGNGVGGPDVEEVLGSAVNSPSGGINLFTARPTVGGGTDFAAGITAATGVAIDPDNDMDRTIVAHLSDGVGGGDVPGAIGNVPSNVEFFTFAVGAGSQCGDPQNPFSLSFIAEETGGVCTEVPDVTTLPDVLPGLIGSELTSLSLRVDAGPPVPISNVTPALPQAGPANVSYTVDTAPLGPGVHELCVTAAGTDAGGGGEVADCHEVVVSFTAEAFAVQAQGALTIPKTPHATCPPDESHTLARLNIGVVTADALVAECATEPTTGTTTAVASVDGASLLGGLITIGTIEAACEADETGLRGSSVVATINGIPIGSGAGSLTIPLVAQVFFNETTSGPNGELVQNAVRVQTLLGQQIILAGCRIG